MRGRSFGRNCRSLWGKSKAAYVISSAQIEEFVATLNRELVARRRAPEPQDKHGLIPVINWGAEATPGRKNRS